MRCKKCKIGCLNGLSDRVVRRYYMRIFAALNYLGTKGTTAFHTTSSSSQEGGRILISCLSQKPITLH